MKRNAFLITNIALIFTLLFACMIAYFMRLNSYDLTIFTWGNYITPNMYNSLEDDEDVKVKETVFPNLEAMMSKLYTTDYNVMLTTDYMVSALIENDLVQPIYDDELAEMYLGADVVDGSRFVDLWERLANLYPVDQRGGTLFDYMVPMYWGDFKIVYNLKSPIVQEMFSPGSEANKYIGTYESIGYIVDQGGVFAANAYPRDVVSIGLKATGHSVNDVTEQSLEDARVFLEPVFKGIKLQGNDLANTLASPDGWDVAYCFPGDVMGAILDNWIYSNDGTSPWYDSYAFYTPNTLVEPTDSNYTTITNIDNSLSSEVGDKFETNDRIPASLIWFDGFTISDDLNQDELVNAYKLINYMTLAPVSLGSWLNETEGPEYERYYGGLKYTYYPSANKNVSESKTVSNTEPGEAISFNHGSGAIDTDIVFNDGEGTTASTFYDGYDTGYSGSDTAGTWEDWYESYPQQVKYDDQTSCIIPTGSALTCNDLPDGETTTNRDANHNDYDLVYDGVSYSSTDRAYQYLYEQALMIDETVYSYLWLLDRDSKALLFNNPNGPEMMKYTYESQQMIVALYNDLLTAN